MVLRVLNDSTQKQMSYLSGINIKEGRFHRIRLAMKVFGAISMMEYVWMNHNRILLLKILLI